jgi:uncharacterized membrane protein
MVYVVVIVAALLGAGLGSGGGLGVFGGALLGWLLWRSRQQARRIAVLEQTVAALQSVESAAAAQPIPVASADAMTVPASPLANDDPSEPIAPPEPTVATAPSTGWIPPPVIAAAARRETVTPPRETPAAWLALKQWLFGGNTIVKLGVGILFIGLAFLARYASEQIEVPVAVRLAGIGAVALVLLALGWRLRLARPGYAQVLQGGAVAVLYLTLFAAFRFYALLPMGPAFALMVVVAALSAALAVLQEAPALAIVGALGGFATPLLLSTGGGSHVALFSYYAVLDLGIAAVAWHKTWRRLNLVGFVCTFMIATAWGVLQYDASHYASSQAFLVFFFLLFNAILLMPARRAEETSSDRWVNGSLLFGLPTITFALQHGLVRDMPYGTALSALALAAFYVGMATQLRQRPALATAFDGSLAVAIVFLSLVVPFALDARSTAGAWALEGAGLVWLGWRQARRMPRAFGYALLFLAGLSMQAAADRYGAPTAVFNATLLNALLAAAGSVVAAYAVHRGVQQQAQHPEALAEPLLIAWALVWALGAAAVQIDHFVLADHALAAWLLVGSVLAVVLTGLSLRLFWPQVALPVMGHAPGMALGVLALAVGLDAPADHSGWWAWPLALACHVGVLRHAAPAWPQRGQQIVHGLGVLVLAGLGALQGRAFTAAWGDAGSAWPWLGWLVVPALLLVALCGQDAARRWPLRAAPSAYQAAGGVLALSLLGWSLLANLASNGAAHPLPYLPLINPLDLGIGLALAAAWRWWRGQAASPLVPVASRWPMGLLAGAGFVWLNAMLVRAFHHFGGVPFHVEAWAQSLAVQAGISLLWTATACVLMRWAAQRARRVPWLLGAALLGAVVLKLLVVDLSGSGTVARIVSFIGVGALMLVIGYVAPWPSSQAGVDTEPADALA